MKKKYLLFLPFLAVTLSGCSFFNSLFNGGEEEEQTPYYDLNIKRPQAESGTGYTSYKYQDADGNLFGNENVRKLCGTYGQYPLNSVGTAKVLVVPVETSDGASRGKSWTASSLGNLQKAFFGDTSSTGWESVKSYYSKSSYGLLNIDGEVASIFKSSYTYAQLDSENNPEQIIANEFNSSTKYNSLLQKYDVNPKDGRLDAVCFIYRDKIKINTSTGDMRWWAFVWNNQATASIDKPVACNTMWASYDFCIYETTNIYGGAYPDDIDSHTYIHEFGHLLGLDDYYSYLNNNHYDPSGGREMHSQNIGDENIYSKLLLGWVQPYYIDGTADSVKLQIRTSSAIASGEKFGDAVIIKNGWNKTPYDEYIIIEYYSPTVLNKQDAEKEYAKDTRMFTNSGFRIYHVDSRVVATNRTGAFQSWANIDDKFDATKCYFIGPSNTAKAPEYSHLGTAKEVENFKLLHLMQAGGTNTFKNGFKASDSDLFHSGSSFTASKSFFYNGTKFNDGTEMGYRIVVGECTNTLGTITITKL